MKCNDCCFYSESYHPRIDMGSFNCSCHKTACEWYRRKNEDYREACDDISQINEHEMECLIVEVNPDMNTHATSERYEDLKIMMEWMDRMEKDINTVEIWNEKIHLLSTFKNTVVVDHNDKYYIVPIGGFAIGIDTRFTPSDISFDKENYEVINGRIMTWDEYKKIREED